MCVLAYLYLLGTYRVSVLETVHAHYMHIPAAAASVADYLCQVEKLLLPLQ